MTYGPHSVQLHSEKTEKDTITRELSLMSDKVQS